MSEAEQEWIRCGSCVRNTHHSVVAADRRSTFDEDTGIDYISTAQVLRCHGCGTHSFRLFEWSSEDSDGPLGNGQRFPPVAEVPPPLADAHLLPGQVHRIYKEVREAVSAHQQILAGIGIRALVEAVCKEAGSADGSLYRRIESLVPDVLTAGNAKVLQGTRLLGNEAAHEVKPPSEAQLRAAIEVAQNLLNNVYIIPELAEDLPQDG